MFVSFTFTPQSGAMSTRWQLELDVLYSERIKIDLVEYL